MHCNVPPPFDHTAEKETLMAPVDDHQIREGVMGAILEVAPEVDPSALDPGVALRQQVDLDSMDWLHVIVGWHQRFGIDIPEADYGRLTTLQSIISYIRDRQDAG
jgi:acyl carrier protein